MNPFQRCFHTYQRATQQARPTQHAISKDTWMMLYDLATQASLCREGVNNMNDDRYIFGALDFCSNIDPNICV